MKQKGKVDGKKLLDTTDINKEFENLNEYLSVLHDCFLAIAMDYKHYVDNSFTNNDIYEIRDDVNYRFFSARLHIELLIKQHFQIEHRFEKYMKTEPKVFANYLSKNPYYDYAEKEVSSIFDSFLYHLTSVFDYLSTLSNYTCGEPKDKQKKLKWTNLSRSVRDSSNHFGKKMALSEKIKDCDNTFVNKLYGYRSYLIHEKSEQSMYSFTFHLSNQKETAIDANFIATERLIKQFSDLRKLSKDNYISIKYVTFWLINKAIDITIDILFALSEDMKQNPLISFGMFAYFDEETKMGLPVSTPYWRKIKRYIENKRK